MEFTIDQRPAITKAIIELTGSSGGSNLVQRPLHRGARFEDNAVVFYEKDKSCLTTTTNLFTAHVRDMELRRALTDPRSSLNLMPPTHKAIGIPRDKIVE